MKARIALGLLLALGAGATVGRSLQRQEAFPHAAHGGLFPLCSGCHAGIPEGDRDRFYPSPDGCARCHDGTRLEPVTWTPTATGSILRFRHERHGASERPDDPDGTPCASCHEAPDAGNRMDVVRPTGDACLGCHEHAAPDHFSSQRACGECHAPLADVPALTAERIGRFPQPPDHDRPEFAADHARDAEVERCAVCHARESCTRCHLNGASLPMVQALQSDERVATTVAAVPPRYERPSSHVPLSWDSDHGAAAEDRPVACANCHVREGCLACHQGEGPDAVALLPRRPEGDPRGVTLAPPPPHPAGYATDHRVDAAVHSQGCAGCHEVERFCVSCHDAPGTPGFHLPNFLERHGPDAYAAGTDCVTCHSPEVFCRGCHVGVGLTGTDQVGVAFHTARPFWLMGHGTAARQGLDGCTSCHTESDCTRCHSATTGWRVSPHGPGFDASSAREANPFSCIRCHTAGGIR